MVRVLDALPDGWRYIDGALTAPTGFRWACSGRSRFSPGYRHAMVRCPLAPGATARERRTRALEERG